MTRAWLLSATLAAIGLAGWQGYRMGEAAAEGRHAAALLEAQRQAQRAADLASRIEAERLAMQAERDRLARDLEDRAHADPSGGGLPAGRVERLRQR